MISPKTITENSDKPNIRGRQRVATENSVGVRILSALGNRTSGWLAREAGVPESTVGDSIKRGVAKAEVAVRFARALGVTVDWLLTGDDATMSPVAAVEDVAFVRLPRFDLAELTDESKGARVETVPVRRDWLYRRVLTTTNLWLTELPADNEPLGLQEGDVVICSDIGTQQIQDNWVCIFRAETGIFVAKYHLVGNVAETGTIGAAALAAEDVRPIARIHARMFARV